MHSLSLSFSRPATSNHVLLKAALLLPLVTGCGGSDEIVGQDVAIPSTSTVPYKAELNPGDRDNAFAPFSADERKKLNPLQVKWLNLINESDAEIEKLVQSTANPGILATKLEQYYSRQVKQFRALKDEIEKTGIDNWRFEIFETGLGFAPGLTAVPSLGIGTGLAQERDNYFRIVPNSYGLFLPLNGEPDVPDFRAVGQNRKNFFPSIGDLSQISQDAFDQRPGTPVYVSIPPGSFFIHKEGHRATVLATPVQIDPCVKPKPIEYPAHFDQYVQDRIVQQIAPDVIFEEEFSKLNTPLRCTMQQRFYIVDPKAILISLDKSDNQKFPKIYQQVLENCRNRVKVANEKLDQDRLATLRATVDKLVPSMDRDAYQKDLGTTTILYVDEPERARMLTKETRTNAWMLNDRLSPLEKRYSFTLQELRQKDPKMAFFMAAMEAPRTLDFARGSMSPGDRFRNSVPFNSDTPKPAGPKLTEYQKRMSVICDQPQIRSKYFRNERSDKAYANSWTLAAEGFRTARWDSTKKKYLVDRTRYDFMRLRAGIDAGKTRIDWERPNANALKLGGSGADFIRNLAERSKTNSVVPLGWSIKNDLDQSEAASSFYQQLVEAIKAADEKQEVIFFQP